MTKLVISMEKVVINPEDLHLLEAFMSKAVRLEDCDYDHRANSKYVRYLTPENVFKAVAVKILDSGEAAVMEMYYDEHVKQA